LGVIAVALFLLVIIGIVIALVKAQTARRNSAIARIAMHLEGDMHDGAEVRGTHRGVRMTYRFATRGSGSSSESWTEVEADVPAAYPLAIHVRRHGWGDRTNIERGNMIDVEVGDAAFDAAFLVEAAPADVAKLLLDRDARAFLAEHRTVELDTIAAGDRKLLRFAIPSWIEDEHQAAALIQRLAGIAARVRDSFAQVEAATPVRDVGAPFRQQLDDQPAREASRAREAEVQRLEVMRAARQARQNRIVVAIVIAIGTLVATAFALAVT
jgi:hypothetical protein